MLIVDESKNVNSCEFCFGTGVVGDPDMGVDEVIEWEVASVEDGKGESSEPCDEAIAEVIVVDELVEEVAGVCIIVISSDSTSMLNNCVKSSQ